MTDIGVTTWFLPRRGVEGLRWAAAAGFDGVHLDQNDLGDDRGLGYRAAASALGIELWGLAACELETIGLSDLESARRVIDDAVEVSAALDLPFLYLPAFEAADLATSRDVDTFAELLRYAVEIGGPSLVVAVEAPLDIPGLHALFDAVDEPRVALLMDTQNCTLRGTPAAPIAAEFLDRIGTVHVKDGCGALGNRRLGAGDAGVAGTIRLLADGGYDGPYLIESDYRRGDLDSAAHDLAVLRGLLG